MNIRSKELLMLMDEANEAAIKQMLIEDDISKNDHSVVVLIGNTPHIRRLKNKLNRNKTNLLWTKKPNLNLLLHYALTIDCIITDYVSLHLTMKILNKNRLFDMLLIPIIVYNDCNDSFIRKVSFLHGVTHYISTNADLQEVKICIEQQIERKKMINSAIFLDELTKVYNFKCLKAIYLQQSYLNRPFTLAIIDLHELYNINERFNMMTGSYVLLTLTKKIKKYAHQNEFVIRLNSDKFLLIFPLLNINQVNKTIQHILDDFMSTQFHLYDKSFYCSLYAAILEVTPPYKNITKTINQLKILLNNAKQKRDRNICIMEIDGTISYQE